MRLTLTVCPGVLCSTPLSPKLLICNVTFGTGGPSFNYEGASWLTLRAPSEKKTKARKGQTTLQLDEGARKRTWLILSQFLHNHSRRDSRPPLRGPQGALSPVRDAADPHQWPSSLAVCHLLITPIPKDAKQSYFLSASSYNSM